MNRVYSSGWVLAVLCWLVGCQAVGPTPEPVVEEVWEPDRFIGSTLDYIADCRIRIQTPAEVFSGKCQLIITHTDRFRLTLFAPFGGVAMDLYLDDDRIRLLNRMEKAYYRLENSADNRRRLTQFVDLGVDELQRIFWGRPGAEDFLGLYTETKDGRPFRVFKRSDGELLVIVFHSWMPYQHTVVPRLLTIENPRRGISIKLAVTDFQPGINTDPLIPQEVPLDYRVYERLETSGPG